MSENLLEQTYVELAQSTLSESQLQKLANSEFEQVREIATIAVASLQSMNESEEITEQMILDTVNMKTATEKLKFFKLLASQAQSITSHGEHSSMSVNGLTVDFALYPTISGGPNSRRAEDSRWDKKSAVSAYSKKRTPAYWYSLDLIYRVNGGDKMYASLGKWKDHDNDQKEKVINNVNKKVQFLKIETDGSTKYRPGVWY